MLCLFKGYICQTLYVYGIKSEEYYRYYFYYKTGLVIVSSRVLPSSQFVQSISYICKPSISLTRLKVTFVWPAVTILDMRYITAWSTVLPCLFWIAEVQQVSASTNLRPVVHHFWELLWKLSLCFINSILSKVYFSSFFFLLCGQSFRGCRLFV